MNKLAATGGLAGDAFGFETMGARAAEVRIANLVASDRHLDGHGERQGKPAG